MCGIEIFVIFAVGTFNLAIMAGSEWTDQLVPDAVRGQSFFKECRLIIGKMSGKFCAVVCLNTFYCEFESIKHVLNEDSGGIGAVLSKSLQVAEAGKLIDSGILVETLSFGFSDKAGSWDKLHVHLDALAWV